MKFALVKHSTILVMTILILSSCSFNSKVEAVFEITNSTNQVIDSLTIQPDENENNHISLEPHSKMTFKTNMTKLPKVDGSYYLSFKGNDTLRGLNFGYYSNGYPAESITRINIQADTILIKPEYNRNY